MLAELSRHGRDFAVRCSAASFAQVRQMLKGEGPAGQRPSIRERDLPLSLTVRLVRVLLSMGEYEVLVTSLLDDSRYPTKGFLELYHLRWGIETFYGLLKTRLALDLLLTGGLSTPTC